MASSFEFLALQSDFASTSLFSGPFVIRPCMVIMFITFASPGFELLKKFFFAIFSKIIDFHDFHIKIMFLGSYLASGGSGMSRNVFLSYFLPIVHAAGAFFSEKSTFLRILDVSFSQKMTFKRFSLCPACRRRFFFLKIAHFQNCGHDKFPKSVFLIKNLIFGVINCRKNINFQHIAGPLILDPS